ncbi:MAG: hypothetical protein K1W22_03795, partial [Lachnospiraceae bacterium]
MESPGSAGGAGFARTGMPACRCTSDTDIRHRVYCRLCDGVPEAAKKEIPGVRDNISILVICQELFEKDFDMFFRKKGNFN